MSQLRDYEAAQREILAAISMTPDCNYGYGLAQQIGHKHLFGRWYACVWNPILRGGYVDSSGDYLVVTDKGKEFLKNGGSNGITP